MTPDQLESKVAAKNARNSFGGVLLLVVAAVMWPITYLAAWAVSAMFWLCVAEVYQRSESEYGLAIFLTSLAIFALLGGYGYFRVNAVFTDEHFERATLSGYGFSARYFAAGIGARAVIMWGIIMCAPIFTRMGIHQLRERLPMGPFTLDLAAKLYNEMNADQQWRPLPAKEPHRSAATLLVKLELLRCSPDRRGGFDIRVPSKPEDW